MVRLALPPAAERRVTQLLVRGYTVQHIAQAVDVSVAAVRQLAKAKGLVVRERRSIVEATC